ncbi:MAG TPA: hypothetical protein HPP87_02075 [Planctomycetes bacterium]|nr:hypothetical protein [Planctomycetota bacterium]HIJ70134.1 hypothetical protein [Planctomycetota bacterium]
MKAVKVILAIITGALLGVMLEFINLVAGRLVLPPYILLTIMTLLAAGISLFIPTRFVVIVLIALILFLVNAVAAVYFLSAFTIILIAGPILIFLVGCIYLALRRAREKAASQEYDIEHLPDCVGKYIESVIRNMRYRRKVRNEVREELAGHFEDALADCQDDDKRNTMIEHLIEKFGDEKLLATLIRRGKKRCRPLWLKRMIRTCQAAGLLIALFFLYTLWFTYGRYRVDIDYLEVINEMGRAGVSESENAWPYYEKAGALYVQPEKWMKNFIRSQWSTLLKKSEEPIEAAKEYLVKWLQKNEDAWQQFAMGSSKKRCFMKSENFTGEDFIYEEGVIKSKNSIDEEQKWLAALVYPAGNIFGDMLRLGRWRLWRHLQQNRISEAIEDIFIMLKAARNLQGQNNLWYEHAISQVYTGSACEVLTYIAASEKLSAMDLQKVYQRLLQIPLQDCPHWNPEPIRTIFLDTVQRIFTDGGPGGGHIIPVRLKDFYTLYSPCERDKPKKSLPFYIAQSMNHAGRDETIAVYDELFESLSRDLKTSPYQRAIKEGYTAKLASALSEKRYSLIHHLLIKNIPFRIRLADRRYQTIAQYEATKTILALKRRQREKGECPEKLEELVKAGYLKQISDDPYSDKPLRYERRENDFVLYSVGANFEDDGGKVFTDSKGKVIMWADEGDAVFWPVQ